MPKDVLDEIMRQVAAAAPELTADRVRMIATGIRRDVGGDRYYIGKAPAEGKVLRLGNALAAGVSLTQAFAEAGVSNSYGYRLSRRRRTA